MLFALCAGVEAQQPAKVPRVGFLANTRLTNTIEPFRRGLQDLGYNEGKNIRLEYRYFSAVALASYSLKDSAGVVAYTSCKS